MEKFIATGVIIIILILLFVGYIMFKIYNEIGSDYLVRPFLMITGLDVDRYYIKIPTPYNYNLSDIIDSKNKIKIKESDIEKEIKLIYLVYTYKIIKKTDYPTNVVRKAGEIFINRYTRFYKYFIDRNKDVENMSKHKREYYDSTLKAYKFAINTIRENMKKSDLEFWYDCMTKFGADTYLIKFYVKKYY